MNSLRICCSHPNHTNIRFRDEKFHLKRTNNKLLDKLKTIWTKYNELMPMPMTKTTMTTVAQTDHVVFLTPSSLDTQIEFYNNCSNANNAVESGQQQVIIKWI